MEPHPRQNDVSHISVDKAGRVLIPSAMRERYGIALGDRVVLQADDSRHPYHRPRSGREKRPGNISRYIKPGVSVVDDLIRERREEAAHE